MGANRMILGPILNDAVDTGLLEVLGDAVVEER
jgi:hypothetical protein